LERAAVDAELDDAQWLAALAVLLDAFPGEGHPSVDYVLGRRDDLIAARRAGRTLVDLAGAAQL